MRARKVRTPQEVIQDFDRKGISISSWARKHGFPVSTVCQVLNGRRQGRRGQGHKIAVLLGIKDGVIVDDECNTFTGKGVVQGIASE